jgi:hypothetical protein
LLNGILRGTIPVSAVAARSIVRSIIWLVLVCLIGLGAVVAIKIGAKTPEGADVDKAKVGAATEHDVPLKPNNSQVCDITAPAIPIA